MNNRLRRHVRLALSVCIVTSMNVASAGQMAAPPPRNAAPSLALTSTCGRSIRTGQTCVITVTAADPDRNLVRISLNWNDGSLPEIRVVSGSEATATFSRTFATTQTVTWSAIAVDAMRVESSPLSGTVTITAPPASSPAPPQPAPTESAPPQPAADAAASAASEQQIASLVVMIRGTLADNAIVGAGIILGVASNSLYIATANHVVRGERPLGADGPVAKDLQVQLRWLRGEWQPARLLEESFDEGIDLAIIRVPGASQLAVPSLPWASFVRPEALAEGEGVIPLGYPGGMPWFMPKQAHVISTIGPQVIKTEGDLAPGYSGGALVTKDWGVTGIILRVGSVQNDVLRLDVALQRMRDWGHEIDAKFKERAKPSGPAADPAATLARDRQEAERLVSRWMAATLSRDVSALVNMAEMPFYFDQEILVRPEDLQSGLQRMFSDQRDDFGAWRIQSIRTTTVGELRAKPDEANRDRVMRNLSMTDTDWHVVVIMVMPSTSRTEGTAFFVRKIGGVMKMVGLWG